MRYRVIAVEPPHEMFPLPTFGLADIASLADAESQIMRRHEKNADTEVAADPAIKRLMAERTVADQQLSTVEIALARAPKREKVFSEEVERLREQIVALETQADEVAKPIRERHKLAAKEEIGRLKERWGEGKIEPALKLVLARNARRVKHWESTCKLSTCPNPRGKGTIYHGKMPREMNKAVRDTVVVKNGHILHRHAAPAFCRRHKGLRSLLTDGDFTALATGGPKMRLVASAK